MTLVDSADSILMLYSYTGFPERSLLIFSPASKKLQGETPLPIANPSVLGEKSELSSSPVSPSKPDEKEPVDSDSRPAIELLHDTDSAVAQDMRVKMNVMSGLSIILTLMSILVAFRSAPNT